MEIIKYFYEEPALLEVVPSDLDPDARGRSFSGYSVSGWFTNARYSRGYVSGTDLVTGRVGFSVLRNTCAFVDPLLQTVGESGWTHVVPSSGCHAITHQVARQILLAPKKPMMLCCSSDVLTEEDMVLVMESDRRVSYSALVRLLQDTSCTLFVAMAAGKYFDWALYSSVPLREQLIAAFQERVYSGVRRFLIPLSRARSEQAFRFELWQLDRHLPEYIEEV